MKPKPARPRLSMNPRTTGLQKTFDAFDWLAFLTTHIPNRREQMVRYYGYYSNKARGTRKKAGTDNNVPAMAAQTLTSSAIRRK